MTSRKSSRAVRAQTTVTSDVNPPRHAAIALAIAALAALTFAGVLRNQFVNWDDTIAITQNPHLLAPGVIRWAVTTTLLDHYQPVAWLVWASVANTLGIVPVSFHAISLLGHALNAALVYILALELTPRAPSSRVRTAGAVIAALTFAVHPVQVEAVAWASAMPYVLALFFLLLSTLLYLAYVRAGSAWRQVALLAASCACYLLSLLSREYAVGYPAVLLAIDYWVLRRTAPVRRVLVEKALFVIGALVGVWLEWHARVLPTVTELGVGQRLELALSTPFRYVGRLLIPASLSPVYPLPTSGLVPLRELGLLLLVALVVATLLLRLRRFEGALCVVAAFLLFVAPTLLAPSGVQASADRYLYIALVPVSVAVGAMIGSLDQRWNAALPVAAVLIATCAGVTIRQVSFWHDSVALWSRAAAVDERNDIATYNLASALADQGRADEAIAWYQKTIALVPDHAQARMNLATLQVSRHENEAVRLATAGQLAAAIEEYNQLLQLDPARPGTRASRGVVLARVGQWNEAIADLTIARRSGITDPEVANSLAFALAHLGRDADAIRVLKDALRDAPDEISLAHNLAQLLLDSTDAATRDVKLAQALALEVCNRTGNRDPRALATLALAYASNGNRDFARRTAERGLTVARANGDAQTIAALEQMLHQSGS